MSSARKQKINFTGLEVRTEPFDHFFMPKAFDEEESLIILDWLRTKAPWKLVTEDFYTQYEFNFKDTSLPEEIAFLNDRKFLSYLVRQFENLFLRKLTEQVNVTAHKLITGHTIRLHNDFIPGQETHRLLVQFNRSWRDENGGFLLLFNSSNPEDIHRIVRPLHNSSVGFAISEKSNHAVSTVHGGERYTLVYSFYAAD